MAAAIDGQTDVNEATTAAAATATASGSGASPAAATAPRAGLWALAGRALTGVGWLVFSVLMVVELGVAVVLLAVRLARGGRSFPRPPSTSRSARSSRPSWPPPR